MPETLKEKEWDTLLWRIKNGKCTPFLGAGAAANVLPLGSDIAKKWAKEESYPLDDCYDLARVSQFLAIDRDDPMYPKEKIVELLKDCKPPDFTDPYESHAMLADLPLSTYLTTNYDDFMMKALKSRNKDPKRELCRWNKYIKLEKPSIFESTPDFIPKPENPLVFHLHGCLEIPESLVLTEDDYLDFIVNISLFQKDLLPPLIQKAIAGASLLFIGYRLADWNFRVLFRGLVNSLEATLRRINVAVQLPEEDKAQTYLTKYFGNTDVHVYWGDAKEFAKDLRNRWDNLNSKKGDSKNDF